MPLTPRRFLVTLGPRCSPRWRPTAAQGPRQPFSRVSVTVTPDRADWTYRPGDPVRFRIDVLRDGHPVQGATVKYGVGPEMLPPTTEATAVDRRARRSVVSAGTMTSAGISAARRDGRDRRAHVSWRRHGGLFAGAIQPTQTNPSDFDAFWDAERDAVGGAAYRRAVDAAARLRHCRGRAAGRSICRTSPSATAPAGSTACSACRGRRGSIRRC